ncbi:MAG TPA: peroxiredoxin [Planctomycetota bacterium]|nr:peroxiredoxin [Planctomycetota bacterium]
MCALRDAAPEFEKNAVTVYGISLDDVKAQATFQQEQKLDFHLLSDPDGSVATKYGVLMKDRAFAQRVTFLVDDKGIVRHVTAKVDIAAHGRQVLDEIARLRATK